MAAAWCADREWELGGTHWEQWSPCRGGSRLSSFLYGWCFACPWTDSIRVAVCLCFFHIHTELVFLVTTHVSVTHEVQGVVVGPSGWGHEVELHLERAGRSQKSGGTSKSYCLATISAWRGQQILTLAFCCRVSLLMEMRLLDLASPITTHQPSSRFCSYQKSRNSACQTWRPMSLVMNVWKQKSGLEW